MFDRQSESRISRTVQEWERFPRERQVGGNNLPVSVGLPQLAIAGEDIEHFDFGDVYYASGSAFDGTITEDNTKIFSAWNPGLMIWDGATVILQHCRLPKSGKNQWVIIGAWSATRIRCTAPSGGIPAGTSATCTSVTALNGYYSPTSTTVYSWTSNVDVGTSEKLLAELVWTGSVSRWEVYSADCT